MLKIRFVRIGRKHDPTYRLVVVDSRKAPRSGAYLENLGNYNPTQKTFNLNEESIREWISKGAQASNTAHNLLIKAKVIKGKKINVSKVKKKKKGGGEDKEQKLEFSASPEANVGKIKEETDSEKDEKVEKEEESQKEKPKEKGSKEQEEKKELT